MIKSKGFGTATGLNHWANNLEREKSISISMDSYDFKADPSCDFKVFIQCEPPFPELYVIDPVTLERVEMAEINKNLIEKQDFFDLILAWHPEVLKNCSNAVKVEIGMLSNTLDCGIHGAFTKDLKNEISFITSDKAYAPGHVLRQFIYSLLKNNPVINSFEVRNLRTPPRIDSLDEMFTNAAFHICVENYRHDNYFTEKIMNCFSTMTIPIYWGAPNIGDYFNEKGIISFNDLEELKHILTTLTPEHYEQYALFARENCKLQEKYRDYDLRATKEIDKALALLP
tara:strand:- start:213 stop:1067 length:855 start_codon:yes stop_codon:yes gene_type:complete